LCLLDSGFEVQFEMFPRSPHAFANPPQHLSTSPLHPIILDEPPSLEKLLRVLPFFRCGVTRNEERKKKKQTQGYSFKSKEMDLGLSEAVRIVVSVLISSPTCRAGGGAHFWNSDW
jgi:hypothetical protein